MKFNSRLKTSDNGEYFITSDLHMFHNNILLLNPLTRPFNNMDDMINHIINEWNSQVGEDDTVFHLGDFSFAGKERTKDIIDRLNGNKVFILGNHDYKVFETLDVDKHYYFEVYLDDTKICMSHYPIAAWNRQGRGSVHLHGHCHGSFSPKGRALDVGYDNVGKIMRLKDAVGICLNIDIYAPDHHKIVGEIKND